MVDGGGGDGGGAADQSRLLAIGGYNTSSLTMHLEMQTEEWSSGRCCVAYIKRGVWQRQLGVRRERR